MGESQPQFLPVGTGPDQRRIAYLRHPAKSPGKTGVV